MPPTVLAWPSNHASKPPVFRDSAFADPVVGRQRRRDAAAKLSSSAFDYNKRTPLKKGREKEKKRSSPSKKSKTKQPKLARRSPVYQLAQQSLGGYSFFDNWDFFTYPDPTHGAVEYVSNATAWANGLVHVPEPGRNSTVMRVDSWSTLPYGTDRQSVRITSKEKVEYGSLVVVDLAKIPYGPTVWPAFWTVGDDWPNGGEIDIVEGVHNQTQNQMTLHTSNGCELKSPMQAVGSVLAANCSVYAASNAGCGVQDPSPTSFGSGFNAAGGGVFAMLWDSSGIAVYFFQRDAIPADIASGAPSPSSWGLPRAFWDGSSCNPQQFFGPQTLVFDITLGGDWAGATYNQAGYAGDWRTAVQDPKNYVDATFEVNYVKVYKQQ
ncbi:hypothetical protein JCM8097_002593 [Rhodosporidiobolus ruineniae]